MLRFILISFVVIYIGIVTNTLRTDEFAITRTPAAERGCFTRREREGGCSHAAQDKIRMLRANEEQVKK
jgi:hypothetical protein